MNIKMLWNLTHNIQKSRLETYSGIIKPGNYCFHRRLGDSSSSRRTVPVRTCVPMYYRVYVGRPHQVIILYPQEAMSSALQTIMHRTQHSGRLTIVRKVLSFHMTAKVYMQFYGLSGKPFAQFCRVVTFVPFWTP